MVGALALTLPEMGAASINYKAGLARRCGALRAPGIPECQGARGGHGGGPHRADWTVSFGGREIREQGSGAAEAGGAGRCPGGCGDLSYASRIRAHRVALDDLASELDAEHQRRALNSCADLGAQLW